MQITLPEQKNDQRGTASLEKGRRRLREFATKFNRDWMMLSAAGLAYSLMIAVVPFGIALLAVLGLTIGHLNPQAQTQLIQQVKHAFPSAISSQDILQPAITRLHQSAGFLAILAVVTAIFGGSRLFIAIERCFDIVYRTYPRKLIPQYVMALLMMLVFIVLIPIMVLASSLPAVILSLIRSSVLQNVPFIVQIANNTLVLSITSLLSGVIAGWILFQAIYMVVPNQRINFKRSWLGAIIAAILLELFLVLFPFYITHFMSSYTGVAGFAVIFLLFFYYFSMILLLGAQINAYFAEGVSPLPDTLATVLHDAAGRDATESAASNQLTRSTMTNPSHAPAPANGANALRAGSTTTPNQPTRTVDQATAAQTGANTPPPVEQKRNVSNLFGLRKTDKQKSGVPSTSQKKARHTGPVVQAVAGTALAFTATVIQLRKKS